MRVIKLRFFVVRSLNEYWQHTYDACVITTWRLGLRAPLVARTESKQSYCIILVALSFVRCDVYKQFQLVLYLTTINFPN